jgi:hypothetical protein
VTETAFSTTCRYETQISNDFGDPVFPDGTASVAGNAPLREMPRCDKYLSETNTSVREMPQ